MVYKFESLGEKFLDGADRQIWTADLTLTKGALYQLSYISKKYLERTAGIEPALLAWKARVIPLYDVRFVQFLAQSTKGREPTLFISK